jgi:hypothetical protein
MPISIQLAGVVGGRLWLTGFPLCFCEKYGKLARTDLKNERISRLEPEIEVLEFGQQADGDESSFSLIVNSIIKPAHEINGRRPPTRF